MAKQSMKARDVKRERLSERFRATRLKLKATIKNMSLGVEERLAAMKKLQALPRDTSAVRVQRRCRSCGRPHAVYRKFALCRICLRQVLMKGHVPGGRKASW